MAAPDDEVAALVARLGLAPHPEGGFYRETFRDPAPACRCAAGGGAGAEGGGAGGGANGADSACCSTAPSRPASTAIYYLLPAGAKSRLHRLDASEVWHAYAGGPITIVELDPSPAAASSSSAGSNGGCRTTVLGRDLAAGETPQHVVPPGVWFGAAPCEGTAWALVGCTVAPAFEFSRFEMGERSALLAEFPGAAEWIERLMAD